MTDEKDIKNSIRYRADNRSMEQFKEDIKEGNRIESEIIQRYCDKMGYSYTQLGHDDGEFKEKSNSLADFLVDGKVLEVKFCRNKIKKFHLKKHHVDEYIKQGAMILFVMGWDEKEPIYTLIDPRNIINNPVKVFWNKLTYICKAKDFKWLSL